MTEKRKGRFSTIPEVVLYHPDLNGTDIRVYCTLDRFTDKTRSCWPSHKTVADKIGLDPSTVKRSIRKLEKAGAIVITRRPHTSNLYYLPDLVGAATPPHASGEGDEAPHREGISAPTPGATVPSEGEPLKENHPSREEQERSALSLSSASQGTQPTEKPGVEEKAEEAPVGDRNGRGDRQEGQERDLCFEELCAIEGMMTKRLTRSARGRIGKSLREIREVSPDVTPEKIRNAAENYRSKHPNWELTANSLASYWGSLWSGLIWHPGNIVDLQTQRERALEEREERERREVEQRAHDAELKERRARERAERDERQEALRDEFRRTRKLPDEWAEKMKDLEFLQTDREAQESLVG